MKRTCILAVLALFVSTNVFAIDAQYESKAPDTGFTAVNGKGWKQYSKKEKEVYVRALMDVLASTSIAKVVIDTSAMDENALGFIESLSGLIPEGMTYETAAEDINKFYEKEDNLIIPIAAAYFSIVAEKQGWVDPETVQASVEKLIKYYKGELDLTPQETPAAKETTETKEDAGGSAEVKKEEAPATAPAVTEAAKPE